jgi:hypothetical protein
MSECIQFNDQKENTFVSEEKRLHIDQSEKQLVGQKQNLSTVSKYETPIQPKEDLGLIQDKNASIITEPLASSKHLEPQAVVQKKYVSPMKMADTAPSNPPELKTVKPNNGAQNFLSEAVFSVKLIESLPIEQKTRISFVSSGGISPVKKPKSPPVVQTTSAPSLDFNDTTPVKQPESPSIVIKDPAPLNMAEVLPPINRTESAAVVQTTSLPSVNSNSITPLKQTASPSVVHITSPPPVKSKSILYVKHPKSPPVVQTTSAPSVNFNAITPVKQTESHPVAQIICPVPVKPQAIALVKLTESTAFVQTTNASSIIREFKGYNICQAIRIISYCDKSSYIT